MSQVLLALAIVLIAARVVGGAAVSIGQPRVVGEIVAGVLIGPSVLGALGGVVDTDRLFPAATRSALGIIGQLGLLLFMLVVGLGFDPGLLAGRVRAVLVVAIAVVAVPVAAGFALLPVLYDDRFALAGTRTAFALFLGAMLSVTAFPVMVRMLEERSLHTSPLGVVAIAAAAVVTVLMFAVTAVAREAVGGHAGDIALVPLQIGGYLALMLGILRPVLARLAGSKLFNSPNGVLGVVVIITLISGRLATDAGLGVIVGGFVAGLVIPDRTRVAPLIAGRLGDLVAVVLLPVFLATSGLVTDFTTLGVSTLPGLMLFLVVAVASKWAVGTAVARLVGLPPSDANALGILMNCRGLLVLVVGLAALEAGVITPQMQVGSVLVALVTTGMTGPLFTRAVAR